MWNYKGIFKSFQTEVIKEIYAYSVTDHWCSLKSSPFLHVCNRSCVSDTAGSIAETDFLLTVCEIFWLLLISWTSWKWQNYSWNFTFRNKEGKIRWMMRVGEHSTLFLKLKIAPTSACCWATEAQTLYRSAAHSSSPLEFGSMFTQEA